MSCTRGILKAIGFGLLGAGSGAALGATGAAVLSSAGHAGYSAAQAAGATSLGSGIMHAGLGFLYGVVGYVPETKEEGFKAALGGVVIDAMLTTGGAALGTAILNTLIEMPVAQVAAAAATGVGVIGAAAIGLGVVAGCCLIPVMLSKREDDAYVSLRV